MQNLLFFMRVAFICNICLLLSWLTKYGSFLPGGFVSSTVFILGIGLSIILNLLVNIFLLLAVVRGQRKWTDFPRWLIYANLLFLIPQIYLLFK